MTLSVTSQQDFHKVKRIYKQITKRTVNYPTTKRTSITPTNVISATARTDPQSKMVKFMDANSYMIFFSTSLENSLDAQNPIVRPVKLVFKAF